MSPIRMFDSTFGVENGINLLLQPSSVRKPFPFMELLILWLKIDIRSSSSSSLYNQIEHT